MTEGQDAAGWGSADRHSPAIGMPPAGQPFVEASLPENETGAFASQNSSRVTVGESARSTTFPESQNPSFGAVENAETGQQSPPGNDRQPTGTGGAESPKPEATGVGWPGAAVAGGRAGRSVPPGATVSGLGHPPVAGTSAGPDVDEPFERVDARKLEAAL